MLDSVCIAWVAKNGIVSELALYGERRRSTRKPLYFGGKEVTVQRGCCCRWKELQRCRLVDAFYSVCGAWVAWTLGRGCCECFWVESQRILTKIRTGRERGECAYSAAADNEKKL